MNIYEAVNKYVQSGYSEDDAIPKVAQDIILLKIGNSKYSKNITVKGGVVMHNISKDMRRATRDMDIDFIKYSLEDKSIREFIKELNNTDDGIKIKITGQNEQTRRNETNNMVRENIHRAHDHLHTAETIIHACYPWRITNVVGRSICRNDARHVSWSSH